MSYRTNVLIAIGAMVVTTLGVAVGEIAGASSARPHGEVARDYPLMLIQFGLLYAAFVCIGGAMDSFFAANSGREPETGKWPENLSDDEMRHRPDSGAAHEG